MEGLGLKIRLKIKKIKLAKLIKTIIKGLIPTGKKYLKHNSEDILSTNKK